MQKKTYTTTTAAVSSAVLDDPTPQQWTDIYMRHNFQDTGLYPTTGSLSASPDIIPAGQQPVGDPTQYITDAGWGTDYGSTTTAQEANFIYVRGANLGTADSSGDVYLYFSPASLLLWPQDPLGDPTKGWANNPLKTTTGKDHVTVPVQAGKRFVTPDPFDWIPQPIANDHYCLISRVVTAQNPNPVPQLGTLKDFAAYISEHPDMAWRNVVTLDPSSPVSTRVQNYSQGAEGGDVYLFLRCENAPVGSAVSAAGEGQGITINIPQANITDPTSFVVGTHITFPANWSGDIAMSWISNNLTFGPTTKITLEAVMPQNPGDMLYERAHALEDLGIPADFIAKVSTSQIGPTKGIRLGSCSMAAPPAALTHGNGDLGAAASASGGGTTTAVGMSLDSVSFHAEDSPVVEQFSAQSSQSSGVGVVTVSVSETPAPADAADIEADVTFAAGSNGGGLVFFFVNAQNVPVGCEVAFDSGGSGPQVSLPLTKITNAQKFVAGTSAILPAGFNAPIKLKFNKNGQSLPTSADGRSVSLSAFLVTADGAGGGPAAGNGASFSAGGADADSAVPRHGKLLGQVTIQL